MTLMPVAARGSLADYRMTVVNAGPAVANNVALTASVDGGQVLGPVTCAASGGAACPATPGASMIVPALPVGGTLYFSVAATIPADSGTFTATMTAALPGDAMAGNNSATASIRATAPNFVRLVSDSGDYIGAGGTYEYAQDSAQLAVTASGARLSIQVTGDQQWQGEVQLPQSFAQLTPGQYANLTRWPFHDPATGGLSWTGEGRGCNTVQGSVTISRATYHNGVLVELDLAFEQHCEGMAPALRGQVHWSSGDNAAPPGPQSPPPAGLWTPAPGSTPATGNYVYFQSDPGDYIGAGNVHTFTQANAILSVSYTGSRLSMTINAGDTWSLDFQAMVGVAQLRPGYYGNLQRYPFHNPARGGMSVYGAGRGCNQLSGWFVIDSITIENNALSAIDLRFEQHCEGGTPALRGRIHWAAGDVTTPAGPVNPPPAGLWSPPPGTTPASGTFIYMQSDPGDYIGDGSTRIFTPANSVIGANMTGGHLSLSINAGDRWNLDFQAMAILSQLQPGYYGDLRRYPFHNPAKGGLSVYGAGRGCNQLTGWFVVDSISIVNNALSAIELRFEQHCEGAGPALRGKIRWVAGDTTPPPGPVNPPPAGLWSPPPGATPATGNFIYLQSDPGDYIGAGGTYLYTAVDAPTFTPLGGRLRINVAGWGANFEAMSSLARLEPGYYGNLTRWPFHNPTTGGLDWSGNGRGCNQLTGWFVVDSVSYAGTALASISLRFEQHCEGGVPALRGQIVWVN